MEVLTAVDDRTVARVRIYDQNAIEVVILTLNISKLVFLNTTSDTIDVDSCIRHHLDCRQAQTF